MALTVVWQLSVGSDMAINHRFKQFAKLLKTFIQNCGLWAGMGSDIKMKMSCCSLHLNLVHEVANKSTLEKGWRQSELLFIHLPLP